MNICFQECLNAGQTKHDCLIMQEANYFLILAIAFILACGIGCSSSSVPNRHPASTPPASAQSEPWRKRADLAASLANSHDYESFSRLIMLLKDSQPDVSYVAAESIETRKDVQYVDTLLTAISAMQQSYRWPAYRALRNYPTAHTLTFLVSELRNELSLYENKTYFDERNSFYLASSIECILPQYSKVAHIPPVPRSGLLSDYKLFLNAINEVKRK